MSRSSSSSSKSTSGSGAGVDRSRTERGGGLHPSSILTPHWQALFRLFAATRIVVITGTMRKVALSCHSHGATVLHIAASGPAHCKVPVPGTPGRACVTVPRFHLGTNVLGSTVARQVTGKPKRPGPGTEEDTTKNDDAPRTRLRVPQCVPESPELGCSSWHTGLLSKVTVRGAGNRFGPTACQCH
jgi:hypothetical protein